MLFKPIHLKLQNTFEHNKINTHFKKTIVIYQILFQYIYRILNQLVIKTTLNILNQWKQKKLEM